ncbi:universal stress protein [bacterium]|nr:MAG: universal stress protein [bacterium]
MIKMDKILLPTDFSEHSKAAAPYAVDIASRYGAELHIIHVFDENALDPLYFSYSGTVGEYFDKVKEGFDSEVDSFLSDIDTGDLTIVPILSNGNPFVEIVRYAKNNDIDMIIIGTHGRTGLSHMLLGSIAEKVIRKAHCPVLSVRRADFEFIPPA